MTTVVDVGAQVRGGRLGDFVPVAVVLIARELMEDRNGYRPRPRAWETRVGEIELLVFAQAVRRGVLCVVVGGSAAGGAGDRRGRDGGLYQRGLDAEG